MRSSATLLLSLAWRNLWRNRRRSIVILIAIVLGVWSMLVMGAFMRGMSVQILAQSINNLTGHLQIHAPQYLDDPVIDHRFVLSSEQVIATLGDIPLTGVATRIRVPGVLASEKESVGITLVGIDPKSEVAISFLRGAVKSGAMLDDSHSDGVILGRKIAERLETEVGKRVVIMTESTHNDIVDRGIKVIGIFSADLESTETAFVFLSREQLARLLGLGDEISEISVRLTDSTQLDAALSRLHQAYPALDIEAWYDLDPISQLMVSIYDSYGIVWHIIVFIAMGFGIVNTLLMAVYERTREFGLFQALGLRPRFILWQVWIEAFLMLIIGLTIGNLASWITVLATGEGIDVSAFAEGMDLANLSKIIPFVLVTKDLIMANGVVIGLGMLTCLYPAWRASRLVPADAITRV